MFAIGGVAGVIFPDTAVFEANPTPIFQVGFKHFEEEWCGRSRPCNFPDPEFVGAFVVWGYPNWCNCRIIAMVVGTEEVCFIDLTGMCSGEANPIEILALFRNQ